jgi:hypothetical protein
MTRSGASWFLLLQNLMSNDSEKGDEHGER